MINDPQFIQKIARIYGLESKEFIKYPSHEGGRNVVYRCGDKVIRISSSSDRNYEDYLAETEYVHYLASKGADTIDVIKSVNGRFVERIGDSFICAFTIAKGDQISDHGYCYREGAPLSEYFYYTGKALGKIHEISKQYRPTHPRFDFFTKYNEAYFDELIPSEYSELQKSLRTIMDKLRTLPQNSDNYGMVHFDYSDGNYNIDYTTGKITVFDFDNCRTFFYLYDLANLWTHGVGWISYEQDREKRRVFMDSYWGTILEGYRSECSLEDEDLSYLSLMIQTVLLENIIDEFEVQKAETGAYIHDEEQAYRMKCLMSNIEYMGFFDEIYDHEKPFELEM